jgi:H+-transporting ATPase
LKEAEVRVASPIGAGNPAAAELKDVPAGELMKRLGTSTRGLSAGEARRRLERYGYNELSVKKESQLVLFLSYFRGTIPYMIMTAAAISAVLGHYPTLAIILVLLTMKAVVGFREEYQAGSTIAALKEKLAVQASVRRDGKWTNIQAREVVPGDIVRLRLGNIIPADARLLEGDAVQVDQSALTGESLPVEHKPGDAVYSGTIVKRGEIDAVVYATGAGTYYGKTAQLVASAKTKSHLQIAIMKMADYLLIIAVILAALIIGVAFARGDPMLDVLQFVLVLIVAAVPVAMPAVLSVTMALGAGKLAEKQAIVTKLSSIEEVAGIDVLCSDKTGTLTQAKLTPGPPFTVSGVSPEEVAIAAALASREEDQAPHRPRRPQRSKSQIETGRRASNSLHAVRSRSQAHRSFRAGCVGKGIQSYQGSATGDYRAGPGRR